METDMEATDMNQIWRRVIEVKDNGGYIQEVKLRP